MKMITMMLALLISFSSFAGKDMKDEKQKGEFLKKELNLSDEQLSKVMEIKKGAREDMHASKKQLHELKKSFKEAMKDSKASNEDLSSKFDAYQKARDEYQRKRFNVMLKMREVLTPAQMEKFQEIRGKFHKKFHKGEKRGGKKGMKKDT